jgi:TolB protein
MKVTRMTTLLLVLTALALSQSVSAAVYEEYDCSIKPDGSFSPDGTKIVFSDFDEEGKDKLFISKADGTGAIVLMPDIPKKEFTPDWSHDGTKIFFISFNAQGNGKIYVVNADGTGKQELMPDDPKKQWSPDVSPDGTKIAYVSRQPGSNQS